MSARTSFNELLESGAHFGHLKSKWNPAMAPYIYAEKNGIHIIDLNKTVAKIDEAADALKQIARSGRKVLFVATKKQAKDIVAEKFFNFILFSISVDIILSFLRLSNLSLNS
jgi:small subunit ribosomal protein S2